MRAFALKNALVTGLVLFIGISQATHAQVTKPAPPTPIDKKKAELGGTPWDPEWDLIIEKALPPEMLSDQVPKGVHQFCPRFHEMGETDKRAFWAYFFQALAGAEASLEPAATVRHAHPTVARRDEVTGRARRSQGLLQLAYADQKRYSCDFDWEADRARKMDDPANSILQPKNNLECGVKILSNQIIVQHKPLLTPSGYWEALHPTGPSHRAFAKEMINPPAACGLPTKSPIDKAATTKTVQEEAKQSGAAK